MYCDYTFNTESMWTLRTFNSGLHKETPVQSESWGNKGPRWAGVITSACMNTTVGSRDRGFT